MKHTWQAMKALTNICTSSSQKRGEHNENIRTNTTQRRWKQNKTLFRSISTLLNIEKYRKHRNNDTKYTNLTHSDHAVTYAHKCTWLIWKQEKCCLHNIAVLVRAGNFQKRRKETTLTWSALKALIHICTVAVYKYVNISFKVLRFLLLCSWHTCGKRTDYILVALGSYNRRRKKELVSYMETLTLLVYKVSHFISKG